MANEEPVEKIGPYIGLRPYEESNRDIFFGREEEQEIIIDKLIANKLTLLFAASGVGKSSLLRAAVLPGLKEMKKENPDVVYYCDWVSDPLEHLKKETVRVLREQKRVAEDYAVYREGEVISLKKFFRLCAIFAGEPLVVILDQFEEFFQYRRYKENFIKFIEEFSECIRDRETQVVFLISMREDFALELNAFKKYLPTILFENYFRLEKLTEEKAREAISKPVDRFRFHYEEKLLETLLKDMSEREKDTQLGVSLEMLVKDIPAYVEPPYLQIVCSRLWEIDQNDPEWKIRAVSYDKIGRAKGIVNSYFHEAMNQFSRSEKMIASSAFDLLITPRGTKMAYTARDLSDRTGSQEKELENVLEKLRKSRILRSQKREGAIWYELYHDIFASIINRWNDKFKSKQWIRWASFVSAIAISAFLVLFIIYDIISNITGNYLRLSVKEMISDRIEVYRGNLKSPNIFGLHEYQAETSFERDQVEPDNLFSEKQIGNFDLLNQELIGHLPLIERISAYWETGEIQKSLDLENNSISENDITRSRQVFGLLPGFGSIKNYEILKDRLAKLDVIDMREEIINSLALMPPTLIIEDFISLLKDKSAEVRRKAVITLGGIGSEQAIKPLLQLLNDPDKYVRSSVADALGMFGNSKYEKYLWQLLEDRESDVRSRAALALGGLGSSKAITPLLMLLKYPDSDVRKNAAHALVQLDSEKAVNPLLQQLKDSEWYVRSHAAYALGRLGIELAVPGLLQLLKDPDTSVRSSAADALIRLGSKQAVRGLLQLLKGPDKHLRSKAAYVLGSIGSDQAVPELLQLLKDPDKDVRSSSVDALGRFGSDQTLMPLLQFLKDPESLVRCSAVDALIHLGSERAVTPLLQMLKDPDKDVRSRAADALALIGNDQTVISLLKLLNDQDKYVRDHAVEALGELGVENPLGSPIQLLKYPDKYVQMRAIEKLGRIGGEKAVKVLLPLLKDYDKYLQSCASHALVRLGSEKTWNILLRQLKNPDKDLRSRAAEALGSLDSKQAIAPLLKLLKDQDADIRRSGIYALAKIGSEQAVTPLLQLIKDPNSDVRSRAAAGLGELGSKQAITPLLQLLKDQEWAVRGSAVKALGGFDSEQVMTQLLKLLKDPVSYVRCSAVETLGELGSYQAVTPLTKLLNDSDPDVRKSTVLSLGKLSAQEKINIIKNLYTNQKEKIDVRITAAATLLKLGDETGLEYLKEISKLDNINRRIELAYVLGEVPSNQGTFLLREMLNDKNIPVQVTVISSIGKTKDRSCFPYLHNLIQSPNTKIREAAVEALAKIAAPESESIEALTKVAMSSDERMSFRLKAIDALTKIQHQDALHALIELLDNKNGIIQYKTIMAIGKNPPSPNIPGPFTDQLKSRLKDQLNGLEKRKARWRKIRDENTGSFTEKQTEDWRKRLEEVEPREPLEFELAFALSRIDPGNEGVKLLGHDLANVREGAWMGLGKSRDVALLEKLYWQRKQSDSPWFIHAAYRAMDYILTGIEAFGDIEELNRLEDLYKILSGKEGKNFHEGVKTRLEWTIDRLKELVDVY